MNHYSGFDPYVIEERNEEIRREVRALQLEGRLRQDQKQMPSRLVAFALRSTLPLLRRVSLVQQ